MAAKMVRDRKEIERTRRERPFIRVEDRKHWYQGLEAMAYLDMM